MTEEFSHDAFISYSVKDKAVVHPIAKRLKKDGLRVWLDDWELKPGDHVQAKIEEGLEHSRVLVFCMSANAFGSDWAYLESGTFRFRDPLNKERRFIPLRVDDAPIKGSLAQFLYINWLSVNQKQEYAKLLEACGPSAHLTAGEPKSTGKHVAAKTIQLDYKSSIEAFAFSEDGEQTLTGAADMTVRLWAVQTGNCLRVLEGHTGVVKGVAWSTDGRRALSASYDKTVRLWDVETGRCLRVLEGPATRVDCVAWSADQRFAPFWRWSG